MLPPAFYQNLYRRTFELDSFERDKFERNEKREMHNTQYEASLSLKPCPQPPRPPPLGLGFSVIACTRFKTRPVSIAGVYAMLTIFKPGCHVKQRKSESRVELGHGRAIYGDRLSLFSIYIYIHVHRYFQRSLEKFDQISRVRSYFDFPFVSSIFFFLFSPLFSRSPKSLEFGRGGTSRRPVARRDLPEACRTRRAWTRSRGGR